MYVFQHFIDTPKLTAKLTAKLEAKAFGTVAIGIMIETEPCYNSAV